ncbi:mechanosensitive ion channel family protein [Rhodohalobacter sp. 614A]|uniref:mechanosensitive ion channel family protein n=1 Tax=Rhodohalobacter sp. 614A TaxID=2908649 RepID=UPI001F306532|nr:mechanosensitive ion channel family protein [Rhodohalobacter sp. 614A]
MHDQVMEFINTYDLALKIIFILTITFILARVVNSVYKKVLDRSEKESDEHLTTYKFIGNSISAIIYAVGISFAIWNVPFLKPIAQSLVAGAGILAIAVGFASQQSLGNIISGFFIVISKPYKINDRISFPDGLSGVVEDIGLRHTVIRNFENQRIIIPNSIISNQLLINSNFEDTKVCKFVDIGISYGSDIDLARKIMTEEIENHPLNIDNRTMEDTLKGEPRVSVRVTLLGDSAVNMRAWAWADSPPNGFRMYCDVLESIKKRFDKEGIVIPFPQRTISYLEPENKEELPPEKE